MDYDKLIGRLYTKQLSYAAYTNSELAHVLEDASTALSELHADNEKLWAELDTLQEPEHFLRWALTIASNLISSDFDSNSPPTPVIIFMYSEDALSLFASANINHLSFGDSSFFNFLTIFLLFF